MATKQKGREVTISAMLNCEERKEHVTQYGRHVTIGHLSVVNGAYGLPYHFPCFENFPFFSSEKINDISKLG